MSDDDEKKKENYGPKKVIDEIQQFIDKSLVVNPKALKNSNVQYEVCSLATALQVAQEAAKSFPPTAFQQNQNVHAYRNVAKVWPHSQLDATVLQLVSYIMWKGSRRAKKYPVFAKRIIAIYNSTNFQNAPPKTKGDESSKRDDGEQKETKKKSSSQNTTLYLLLGLSHNVMVTIPSPKGDGTGTSYTVAPGRMVVIGSSKQPIPIVVDVAPKLHPELPAAMLIAVPSLEFYDSQKPVAAGSEESKNGEKQKKLKAVKDKPEVVQSKNSVEHFIREIRAAILKPYAASGILREKYAGFQNTMSLLQFNQQVEQIGAYRGEVLGYLRQHPAIMTTFGRVIGASDQAPALWVEKIVDVVICAGAFAEQRNASYSMDWIREVTSDAILLVNHIADVANAFVGSHAWMSKFDVLFEAVFPQHTFLRAAHNAGLATDLLKLLQSQSLGLVGLSRELCKPAAASLTKKLQTYLPGLQENVPKHILLPLWVSCYMIRLLAVNRALDQQLNVDEFSRLLMKITEPYSPLLSVLFFQTHWAVATGNWLYDNTNQPKSESALVTEMKANNAIDDDGFLITEVTAAVPASTVMVDDHEQSGNKGKRRDSDEEDDEEDDGRRKGKKNKKRRKKKSKYFDDEADADDSEEDEEDGDRTDEYDADFVVDDDEEEYDEGSDDSQAMEEPMSKEEKRQLKKDKKFAKKLKKWRNRKNKARKQRLKQRQRKKGYDNVPKIDIMEMDSDAEEILSSSDDSDDSSDSDRDAKRRSKKRDAKGKKKKNKKKKESDSEEEDDDDDEDEDSEDDEEDDEDSEEEEEEEEEEGAPPRHKKKDKKSESKKAQETKPKQLVRVDDQEPVVKQPIEPPLIKIAKVDPVPESSLKSEVIEDPTAALDLTMFDATSPSADTSAVVDVAMTEPPKQSATKPVVVAAVPVPSPIAVNSTVQVEETKSAAVAQPLSSAAVAPPKQSEVSQMEMFKQMMEEMQRKNQEALLAEQQKNRELIAALQKQLEEKKTRKPKKAQVDDTNASGNVSDAQPAATKKPEATAPQAETPVKKAVAEQPDTTATEAASGNPRKGRKLTEEQKIARREKIAKTKALKAMLTNNDPSGADESSGDESQVENVQDAMMKDGVEKNETPVAKPSAPVERKKPGPKPKSKSVPNTDATENKQVTAESSAVSKAATQEIKYESDDEYVDRLDPNNDDVLTAVLHMPVKNEIVAAQPQMFIRLLEKAGESLKTAMIANDPARGGPGMKAFDVIVKHKAEFEPMASQLSYTRQTRRRILAKEWHTLQRTVSGTLEADEEDRSVATMFKEIKSKNMTLMVVSTPMPINNGFEVFHQMWINKEPCATSFESAPASLTEHELTAGPPSQYLYSNTLTSLGSTLTRAFFVSKGTVSVTNKTATEAPLPIYRLGTFCYVKQEGKTAPTVLRFKRPIVDDFSLFMADVVYVLPGDNPARVQQIYAEYAREINRVNHVLIDLGLHAFQFSIWKTSIPLGGMVAK